MKRVIYIIAVALLFLACNRDFNDTPIYNEGATTLTLQLEQSRTALGDKSGDNYPVYWSDGDKIALNGKVSLEAEIDPENRTSASFRIEGTTSCPYHITYPYTASTTAEQAKVLFPAEQSYTEGSFAQESAPMCGYAATASEAITLKHLAGVLRLPIKAEKEGLLLEKVVIKSNSGAALSGIFSVDCESATITPSEECSSTITYSLPQNFALSTTTDAPLYIALPAVNTGSCTIELHDASGGKMLCYWQPTTAVKRGVVREFKSILYKAGVESSLEPFIVEEDRLTIRYSTIFGYVKDSNGAPIAGVPVSDGFTITTTDANGYYSLNISSNTWYIYLTLPAEYEVPINELGQACFWKKYPSDTNQYDFTLTPLAGGKEEKFALFTFGDPQVSGETNLQYFNNEAVPSIKAHCDELSQTMPCYGITLGDIISNGTSADRGYLRAPMRDGFSVGKVGMPVFHVMGNHDCTFYNSSKPIFPDPYNSTYNIAAQRDHEDIFGPANFSFNRGNVHIIGMRDIIFTSHTTQSVALGFLKEQYEWLKQDLALVPKDHTILFCVHIPMMRNNTQYYTQEVLTLLNSFEKVRIISGHRHFVWNYDYAEEGTAFTNLYEHVMGAVCGAWWRTNMCGDGAPCGYGVFVGEGNEIVDAYHIGIHEGMNNRSHQMRLYRGNAITGAAIEGTNTNGTKGYYAFHYSEDTLLANVYFADNSWTIKVYENGEYSGNMELEPYIRRQVFSSLAGDGSIEAPFTPTTATSNDTYVTGLMLGILGLSDGTGGARDECHHLYKYTLKDKDAEIKVEATDSFGNIYTETTITEGTDYSITAR